MRQPDTQGPRFHAQLVVLLLLVVAGLLFLIGEWVAASGWRALGLALVGTLLLFLALVCVRFLIDRSQPEDAVEAAIDRAEAEVEHRHQAQADARAAGEQITGVLATMSDELRAPMTRMLLASELLKRQTHTVDTSTVQAAQQVYDGAQLVLSRVDSARDLARLEAGKIHAQNRRFALEPLLEDLRLLLNPAAEGCGTRLYVLFSPDLPASWDSDPTCLRQLLINLVSNAIERTQKGSVLVNVRTSNRRLLFEVIDTGAGLAAEDTQRISEPLARPLQSPERGTSLAMTLCRHYAELIDGQLILQHSMPGRGSRVRLLLPAPPVSAGNVDTIGAGYVSDRLAGLSFSVQSARAEATRWAESWLRSWGAEIGLLGTPCVLEETLPGAIGNVAELALHLGALTGSPIFDRQNEATGTVRGCCLVCDDDPMTRDVLTAQLESLSYAATAVASGSEVLAALQQGDFDLLFLAVPLADGSASEVLNALRAEDESQRLPPVCVISNSPLEPEQEHDQSGTAVASARLLKPPRLREVAAVAATLINAARAS